MRVTSSLRCRYLPVSSELCVDAADLLVLLAELVEFILSFSERETGRVELLTSQLQLSLSLTQLLLLT